MMRAARTRAVLTALIMAGSLAVAGCGGEDGGSAAADKSGKEASDEKKPDGAEGSGDTEGSGGSGDSGGNAGKTAASLRFASTTLDGKAYKGSELADKPSVLWFWAPWCGTCRGQASQTAKLADKYEDRVNFLGVAGLDKTAPMNDFVSAEKVGNFPHLNDQEGSVWRKFGVTKQSSYVMLDKNGRTVHEGAPSTPAELDKLVADLAG